MSILRGIAVLLLSSIFVFSLFMGITSYTIGDLIQKESLKGFIETGMAPSLIESQCTDFCSGKEVDCFGACIDEMENQTSKTINDVIDNVYESNVYGVSIGSVISILSQLLLFVAIAVITGTAIFFVSDEPFSVMGRNVLSVSITLLITAFSPNLILSLSNVEMNSVFSGYLSHGLELQALLAVVFIAVAIVFLVADYLIKRKRLKKR